MKKSRGYANIDMELTGKALRERVARSGYSVGEIQKELHLSCPQPIYRWFKGQTLPSVNHLYMLSRILECHMEELLVEKQEHPVPERKDYTDETKIWKRLEQYSQMLGERLELRAA